jgi:hypothetical protein
MEIGRLEYRLDLRAKGGNVTQVRILTRGPEGKWQVYEGEFTNELSVCLRKFAKGAAAVTKAAVPPLDVEAIIRAVNGSRRKSVSVQHERREKRASIQRQSGNGGEADTDAADW